MTTHTDYRLPDGRIISLSVYLTRLAPVVSFTLANGRVVDAIIVAGQR